MKSTLRLLATRRVVRPAPDVAPIIPPLKLYKHILRAHRQLPSDIRVLGDEYVKAEFKLHKSLDNPAQVIGFLTSWQHYLECLEGHKWKHQKLDMDKISRLDDQQIIQVSISICLRRPGSARTRGSAPRRIILAHISNRIP